MKPSKNRNWLRSFAEPKLVLWLLLSTLAYSAVGAERLVSNHNEDLAGVNAALGHLFRNGCVAATVARSGSYYLTYDLPAGANPDTFIAQEYVLKGREARIRCTKWLKEPVASLPLPGFIDLTWSTPVTRIDNAVLHPTEIDYYEILDETSPTPTVVTPLRGNLFVYNVNGYGVYRFRIRTVDTRGQRSAWSPQIEVTYG